MMTLLCPVAPEANDHRWDGQRRFLSQFWKPEVQNQGVKRATLHSEYQEVDLSQVPQYQVLLEPLSPLSPWPQQGCLLCVCLFSSYKGLPDVILESEVK